MVLGGSDLCGDPLVLPGALSPELGGEGSTRLGLPWALAGGVSPEPLGCSLEAGEPAPAGLDCGVFSPDCLGRVPDGGRPDGGRPGLLWRTADGEAAARLLFGVCRFLGVSGLSLGEGTLACDCWLALETGEGERCGRTTFGGSICLRADWGEWRSSGEVERSPYLTEGEGERDLTKYGTEGEGERERSRLGLPRGDTAITGRGSPLPGDRSGDCW